MSKVMIQVNNFYSHLHGPKELILDLVLSFQILDPKRKYNPLFQRKIWDGYVKYVTPKGRFKTGILPLVLRFLKKKNIPYTFMDNRELKEFDFKPNFILNFKNEEGALRDYQADMLVKACNRTFKNLVWNRGIIAAATNAGKTEIASAMYNSYNYGGDMSMLFIVHRKELFNQTVARLSERLQIDIGEIQGKKNNIKQVTVGMVQSLYSKMKKDKDLINPDIIFFDEVHGATSPSAEKVIQNCNSPIIYGLSGTPFKDKLHKHHLIGTIGPIMTRISNRELMDKGVSAEAKIRLLEYDQLDDSKRSDNFEYREYHLHFNDNRNDKLINTLISENCQQKQALFVVDREQHGRELQKRFLKYGIKVPFVYGSSSDRFREKILRLVKKGKQKWTICSTIWKEGIDTPNIQIIAMMLGGSSVVTVKQFIGRGTRKKTDDLENVIEVWDFIDSAHKKLLEHTQNRINLYNEEKFKFLEIPECLKKLKIRLK